MQPSMTVEQWLSLTDYSSKYRVSVSTLRRRIKNNQIAHRFIDGKYMLLDTQPAELDHGYQQQQPLDQVLNPSSAAEFLRGLGFEKSQEEFAAKATPLINEAQYKLDQLREAQQAGEAPSIPNEEPIISSATRLLSELKRAYMNILQEKEEQIIQLKEEVSDLKTLVRVLEDDNERMRREMGLRSPTV